MKGVFAGQPNFELEELSVKEQHNEYILTALRTKWGADLQYIKQQWGGVVAEQFLSKSINYQAQGYILKSADNFTLSNAGKLLADSIISDLFW
jgi:oxygen-independent coproporphyrinogen-3 oxidase